MSTTTSSVLGTHARNAVAAGAGAAVTRLTSTSAKKAVLLLMAATGIIAVIQAARAGHKPRLSIGVGVIGSGVILAALAEVAPTLAVSLAGLTTLTAGLADPSFLDQIGATLTLNRTSSTAQHPIGDAGPGAGLPSWLTGIRSTPPSFASGAGEAARTGTGPAINSPAAPSNLIGLGQAGQRLTAPAASAFKNAENRFGQQIWVTDSYRDWATQERGFRSNPNRFVAPQYSAHVRGEAIDVDSSRHNLADPQLKSALTGAGFCQSRPSDEPWHYSFNGCQ